MRTEPAITLLIAGLFVAGLAMVGQPGTTDAPQLSTLLPPLLDRLGSLAVECLQWLAMALKRN